MGPFCRQGPIVYYGPDFLMYGVRGFTWSFIMYLIAVDVLPHPWYIRRTHNIIKKHILIIGRLDK